MSETRGDGNKAVVLSVTKGPYAGERIVLDVEEPAGRNLGEKGSDIIFSEINKLTNLGELNTSSASITNLSRRWFIGRAKARRRNRRSKSAKDANSAKLRFSLCKDPLISSEHACIEVTCAGLAKGSAPNILVQIHDVGSSNGTKVNGDRLVKGTKHNLQLCDVIKMGGTELRVEKIGIAAASIVQAEDVEEKEEEEEMPFACPVCRKNLSHLTGTLQNKHVNDCLDGNKTGISNEAESASVALAVVLQNDPDATIVDGVELNQGSIGKNIGASVVSKCVVCGLNLSLMSVKGRERHINQCLDASVLPLSSRIPLASSHALSSSSPRDGAKAARKRKAGLERWFKRGSGLDHCIICKKKWKESHKQNPDVCISHLRFCQQQQTPKLTVEELKSMVKAAEKKSKLVHLGWESNKITFSGPSPDDFVSPSRKNSMKRKRSTSKTGANRKSKRTSRNASDGGKKILDKGPGTEVQPRDIAGGSDEENAKKDQTSPSKKGKDRATRKSVNGSENIIKLSLDESAVDTRIAKLERQIAVIDSQIDKLKVYRGSLEKNLNRAKLELSKSLIGQGPTNLCEASPGTAARRFFLGGSNCFQNSAERVDGLHVKSIGAQSELVTSKLASESNKNQYSIDLWNDAASSQDPNFAPLDQQNVELGATKGEEQGTSINPLDKPLNSSKEIEDGSMIQQCDNEESVGSVDEADDDHSLSQLIHSLDSSQSGDESSGRVEIHDSSHNVSGVSVADVLDSGSDSVVEISSDIPASDMMFGTGSQCPDGPVLGANRHRISSWLAKAPASFGTFFPRPERQLKFVMEQDQNAIKEALRNLKRDKGMVVGEEFGAMNYLESILESLLSDLEAFENVEKQPSETPGACPDYGAMSTEKLKALMKANGMKTRPHTVMVDRLAEIWHTGQMGQSGASSLLGVDGTDRSRSMQVEGSGMSDTHEEASTNLSRIIFKTIINDPKLYSHVLQFKAVRVPALCKIVMERNEGVRCSHKDCQKFLDSKGIANTWQ